MTVADYRAPDHTVSTRRAADLAGLSYRQVDYWVRVGVFPWLDGLGSGGRRRWHETDVRTLTLLADIARVTGRTDTRLLERVAETFIDRRHPTDGAFVIAGDRVEYAPLEQVGPILHQWRAGTVVLVPEPR